MNYNAWMTFRIIRHIGSAIHLAEEGSSLTKCYYFISPKKKTHCQCYVAGNTGWAEGSIQAIMHAVSSRQTPGPWTKASSRTAI